MLFEQCSDLRQPGIHILRHRTLDPRLALGLCLCFLVLPQLLPTSHTTQYGFTVTVKHFEAGRQLLPNILARVGGELADQYLVCDVLQQRCEYFKTLIIRRKVLIRDEAVMYLLAADNCPTPKTR